MNRIFETERLYICPIENELDIEGLYNSIYSNCENLKFLNYNENFSLNNLKLKLLLQKKYYKVDLGIYLAKHKLTNEIIAESGFFNSFDNLKTPEIGYIINQPHWNKGYGHELVKGMITYLFSKNVDFIYSRMNILNTNSYKICKKLGFEEVKRDVLDNGIIRQTLILHKKSEL